MDNSVYRRNVFKTLSVRPAKIGLKYVSRNTNRTNVMHASFGLLTEASELVTGLAPYLLGVSRLTEPMKINAFEEMGDIGYYLSVLSKALKVKLPASSKKVRLKTMTRSAALLEVLRLSQLIGNLSKKVFYGPVMVQVEREKKVITLAADGSVDASVPATTVMEKVDVLAPDETLQLFAERDQQVVAYLQELIPLYWALCFDMFDVPPAFVFVGNIAKLSKRYGEGFFQLSEAEERDLEEEQEALTGPQN